LVAARVGNSQRGFLWVFHSRRRLESIGSELGWTDAGCGAPEVRLDMEFSV
jgi:hypothetical protein